MKFRKLKKQTKQKQEPTVKVTFASYPLKIKAFITDMFMIYAPLLYIIAYVILDGKDAFQSSQIAPFAAVTLYGLIDAVFISRSGQTPGKKAYGFKVVNDKTFEKISYLRAFLRFVAFLFSATILIGLIVPFYRKDKKALHDVLCSTVQIMRE